MGDVHDEHCEGEWVGTRNAWTGCRCSERKYGRMLPDVPITEEEAQLMTDHYDEIGEITPEQWQACLDRGSPAGVPPQRPEPGAQPEDVWRYLRDSLEQIGAELGVTAQAAYGPKPNGVLLLDIQAAAKGWREQAQRPGITRQQPIATGTLLDANHIATGDVHLTIQVPEAEYAEWLDDAVQVFVTQCNHLAPTDEHELRIPPDPTDEVLAAIGDTPIVIWFCPDNSRHRVEWTTHDDRSMTPRCLDCGQVGATRVGATPPAPET